MTDDKHLGGSSAAHSSLVGGSTAARRIGCPRSYALEQLVPNVDNGSIYALEGSAIHEIMALALSNDQEPTDLLPFEYTDARSGEHFTITEALWREKGEPALTAFDNFVGEEEDEHDAEMRLLIEKSVEFPGIPGAFGTSDITGVLTGGGIYVLDWKFGNGIVPAEENKQLMFYACGAINSYPEFFEGVNLKDENTPVTLAILQPARPDCIDVWRTTLGRLWNFEEELAEAIHEIQTEGMEARQQDGSWCTFARCKPVCKLHLGAAAKLNARFADLKAAINREPDAPKINDWGARWAELLQLAEMVEPFLKEIAVEAHKAAESGLQIPGWGLDMKRAGGRKWAKDESEVIDFLGQHLDEEAFLSQSVISMPQAEKLLKAKGVAVPEDMFEVPPPSGTKLVRSEKVKEGVATNTEAVNALADRLSKLKN